MATGIYLVDHPPRTQQFRCPRRERPSGVIGVHTAESVADEAGPDTGAENVADFIRRRDSYGSYHLLCDSDSIVQLVEFRCVAYHIGTYGLNEHSIGVSAAVQASRWNEVSDEWEDATLRNMARASARAARWVKQNYGITIPARRLTLSQARAKVPGFIAHGDADPARRTDPDGPNREFKWSRFLSYYAAEMGGGLEDDMPDIGAIKQAFRDVLNEGGHASPYLDGKYQSRDLALRRASINSGNAVNMIKYQVIPELAVIRAAQNGQPVDIAALAEVLAGLLLPELREDIRAELEDVDGVDEAAVADRVVAKIGQALTAAAEPT